MKLFKFTSKDKSGNREVRMAYIDGIPNLFTLNGEICDVTINKEIGKLTIKSAVIKNHEAHLDLDKIIDARVMTEKEIVESDKSVIGRAVVGGLLLGPLGGIVGGMSGIGSKKKTTNKTFMIISYMSGDEEKKLVFEIVGASIGWDKMVKELPKKYDENNSNGPVEL